MAGRDTPNSQLGFRRAPEDKIYIMSLELEYKMSMTKERPRRVQLQKTSTNHRTSVLPAPQARGMQGLGTEESRRRLHCAWDLSGSLSSLRLC